MSRKWERMVEKNKKLVNKSREKEGKSKISSVDAHSDIFTGRSIFLPIFFMSISIMSMMFLGQAGEQSILYWITVFSYFVLALYFFFLKRPYLRVGKAEIATRKFGREKAVPAANIEKIIIQPSYIIIAIKGKRTQLVFSRFFNRYDLTAMADRLKEFSHNHTISYQVEK